jgi:hypothetical protein
MQVDRVMRCFTLVKRSGFVEIHATFVVRYRWLESFELCGQLAVINRSVADRRPSQLRITRSPFVLVLMGDAVKTFVVGLQAGQDLFAV